MAERRTHLIVGGGMAGAKAAAAMREHGFDGRIVLIGAESELPYERPPLSKDYLRGETPLEKAHVHPQSFYDEHDVELRLGTTVTAIDPSGHRVTLDDGSDLGYDRLLLATGAVPRRPPIPGADGDGVHLLRSARESDALRDAIKAGGPLVVIGGGWIGCEVAASARQLGADVALVELASTPLEGVLGPELGRWFADLHAAHGVRLHLGTGVERIDGDHVTLGDGTVLDAAAVVIGVGVAPDTRLAEAAGLEVDNGIVCDDLLRTSAPDVYAAGDVASAYHPRYRRHVRVEHWSTALNQGTAAGASMADHGTPYDRLPYFFTDQYDAGMEYIGLHRPGDRVAIRGNPGSGVFQAAWHDAADDHVTAAMHVNDWDAMDDLRALAERGAALESRPTP